jgi:hypothetical protein
MGMLIENNGEFFLFLKREFPEREFTTEILELMFLSYVAGKYGIKPQKPALFNPLDNKGAVI